jgi:hypothetical protein
MGVVIASRRLSLGTVSRLIQLSGFAIARKL